MAAKKYIRKKTKINGKRTILVWVFVGLFFLGTVVTTIQTATMGATLASYEERREKLAGENEELNERLFQSTSLMKIGRKAEELEFYKPSEIVYIDSEVPVAKLPN